jgi:hypothetical protein
VKNSERRVYWLLLVCLLMLAAVITLACGSGASGTFAVVASDYPNQSGACPANLGCGAGCVVSGSAQLTCP